jgi:hypothetical protein
MKRKIVIVASVLWLACALGGIMWGHLEPRIREAFIPPQRREMHKLRQLQQSGLYTEVVDECDRASHVPGNQSIAPAILYIRWCAEQHLGHKTAAMTIQDEFFNRYPQSALAADLHFSRAMSLIDGAKYVEAETELKRVTRDYAESHVASRAAEILNRLRTQRATSAAPESGFKP